VWTSNSLPRLRAIFWGSLKKKKKKKKKNKKKKKKRVEAGVADCLLLFQDKMASRKKVLLKVIILGDSGENEQR
jgi:hypothetical protein